MQKEIMGKVKGEPTREEIKEAFNKTIERWEKIVEKPSYYNKSDCELCGVHEEYEGDRGCHKYCPIRSYGNHDVCENTPHDTFHNDKTPANALAELNFLRKVYIWWMEKEANKIWDKWGTGWLRARKEEKKEEYEDITEEIEWKIGSMCKWYWLMGFHGDSKEPKFITEKVEIEFNRSEYSKDYQIVKMESEQPTHFRILKKI